MAEFSEDFEGAADGVGATTTTTAFDAATNPGATMTHSTLHANVGSKSLRINNPATTQALYRLFGTARTVIYRRVYWYAAALDTTAMMSCQTGASTNGSNVQISAAGAIRLRDTTTVIATSSITAVTGQWYRFEQFVNAATGTHTLRVFTGANLEGTTPDDTISGALAVGSFDRAVIGTNAANAVDWFWDAYADDPTTWVGPAGGGGGGGGPTIEFTEDFDIGPDGALASPFETVDFESATAYRDALFISNLHSITGSYSLRILNPTATTYLYNTVSPARTVIYQRFYFYMADWTNGTTIAAVQTGTTLQGNVQVPVTGSVFRIRDGTTITASSAMTPAVGQWYRLEYKVDMGAGTHALRIFTGANLHGTTADEEISGSLTTGTFDRYVLGTNAANTLDWFVDAYANAPDNWVGPATITATGGKLQKEDATGNYQLEDGSGVLVTEDYVAPTTFVNTSRFFLVL